MSKDNQRELEPLRKALVQAAELKGTFKLRSGTVSSTYFDKYRFEANPELLLRLTQAMVALVPDDTEVVAGIELGGIPLVTALSLQMGLPASFVRKEAKTYGTCNLAEGVPVKGKRVLVVEDVVSTGGQVLASIEALRQEGAQISHALCVFLRNEDAIGAFNAHNLTLPPLFVEAR